MGAETKWSRGLTDYLRNEKGWLTRTLGAGQFDQRNWPDTILISQKLGCLFVEWKDWKTVLEKAQAEMLYKLHNRIPGYVFLGRKLEGKPGGNILHPVNTEVVLATFLSKQELPYALETAQRLLLPVLPGSDNGVHVPLPRPE